MKRHLQNLRLQGRDTLRFVRNRRKMTILHCYMITAGTEVGPPNGFCKCL